MKKLVMFLISLTVVCSLAACSSNRQSENEGNSSEQVTQSTEQTSEQVTQSTEQTAGENAEEAETQPEASGKILIAYFSATGNTETAANYIAAATNGDLFVIEPAEPYTDDDLNWNDENSRVVREHDNPDERDIALAVSSVDNWEEYDTVFIGYPIWWSIAAWPVDTFVKSNDFTGKTVIPFCTSSSSALGESGTLLEEMAGTGNWLEGNRFSSNVSESDVQEWIEGLGL